MIVPVFKTGGWHLAVSPVGSTPTRFRHFNLHRDLVDLVGIEPTSGDDSRNVRSVPVEIAGGVRRRIKILAIDALNALAK